MRINSPNYDISLRMAEYELPTREYGAPGHQRMQNPA